MEMTSTFRTLIVLGGVLATSAPVLACRWFGTQLDCPVGKSHVVIGTQAAEEPSYRSSVRPQSFHGEDGLPDDRVAIIRPFQLDLQNIGADASLCRRIGNETYCY
jgi:hypothetical protein